MPNQFTSAAIRAGLATILVIVWVVWYDGPPWAWALLVGYIAFTFGIAIFIQRKMEATIKRKQEEQE
jgi:hypothetical protein